MQKKLTVTSTERNSGKTNVLFHGLAVIEASDEGVKITYCEKDKKTKVQFQALAEHAYLRREGEATTLIHFDKRVQRTPSTVTNNYGEIEMMIQTHKYLQTTAVIAIEYDVLHNEEIVESYRLMWKIKDLNA